MTNININQTNDMLNVTMGSYIDNRYFHRVPVNPYSEDVSKNIV